MDENKMTATSVLSLTSLVIDCSWRLVRMSLMRTLFIVKDEIGGQAAD
jgi:hypothetical protein